MKDRVMAINESIYTLTTRKNTNCKSCIYNSEHNGYSDGGCICEKNGTHILEPETCICTSFVNEPMSRENAIGYLQLIGWMQEHDKALTENAVPVVRCKDCIYYQDNNDGYPHDGCRWRSDETPDADDFCSFAERKNDE